MASPLREGGINLFVHRENYFHFKLRKTLFQNRWCSKASFNSIEVISNTDDKLTKAIIKIFRNKKATGKKTFILFLLSTLCSSSDAQN